MNETREALLAAESFGDAYGLALARWAHGAALLRSRDPDRAAGLELLHQSRSEGIDLYRALSRRRRGRGNGAARSAR